MPFPVLRTESERWRTFLQQRREHGDAQTRCPDAIHEAEALFEILHGIGSYDTPTQDDLGSASNYKTLRLQQDRDWARSIALGVSEESNDFNQDDALEKLGHALVVDPDCHTALCRRARLLIDMGRYSGAKKDIARLRDIQATFADPPGIAPEIESLNALLRRCLNGDASNTTGSRGCSKRERGASGRRHSSKSPTRSARTESRSHAHRRHGHGEHDNQHASDKGSGLSNRNKHERKKR